MNVSNALLFLSVFNFKGEILSDSFVPTNICAIKAHWAFGLFLEFEILLWG
jgi:hypothetical protein